MNPTTVTTPNELEISVERIFDAPRAHVFSVWTDPKLIPEWWGDGTVVEEMDVRPGGTYRFRTAYGVVEGEFREVDPPERLVQTFQNHLQTLEFEDLGEQTKLTQTMRFATTEERDTTMQYGVEEGAKSGFARDGRAAAAANVETRRARRKLAWLRRRPTKKSATHVKGFTAEERAAMKERAQELKAEARAARKGRGKRPAREARRDAGDRIAPWASGSMRSSQPTRRASCRRPGTGCPRTPRDGKVVCFFQSADKFKARYATFGFNDRRTSTRARCGRPPSR